MQEQLLQQCTLESLLQEVFCGLVSVGLAEAVARV
jgi:hypothetical protein